jgi:hypothetical protein
MRRFTSLQRNDEAAKATMRPNPPASNLKKAPTEDAETEQTTTSQEDKQPVASLLSQPTAFAEEQWKRASLMLKTNPTLVTNHILCMALRHRPPLHVIHFMLHLNSKAASIPKKGPTPLQVAIQSACSLDVIKALIQACPFALVATNPGSYLDPLSYVKRFRPNENDLIGLLSLPLSHWLCGGGTNSGEAAGNTTSTSTDTSKQSTQSTQSTPSNPSTYAYKSAAAMAQPQQQQSSMTPSGLNTNYNYNPIRSTLSAADRQELNNVKTLCAGVVKGHKRLSREMEACKEHVASTLLSANATTVSSAELEQQQTTLVEKHQEQNAVLLKEMQDQQQKHFRVQLIALDMKEKAMRAHVHGMERRIVQQVLEYNKNALPLQPPTPSPPPPLQHGMEEAYKSMIRTLQMQMQAFQRRLEQVEGHMEPRARYSYQPRSLPGTYRESNQQRCINNSNKYQLSYSSRCNDTDTACSARSSVGSSIRVVQRRGTAANTGSGAGAMPVVCFATPLPEAVVQNQDDDSLSLLSEDLHVTRPGHRHYHAATGTNNNKISNSSNKHGHQPFWWLTRMGRRCWLVVVRVD